MTQRGNCYHCSEALYHILGGKKAGWKPMYMNTRATGHHWFLLHKSGMILDATKRQFGKVKPDYSKARGCGFLTKRPSKGARQMMEVMTWKDCER